MGYFGAFGFHPKSTGGGGGSGSVTAVGAGTGMNFPTITGTGNVNIDTTKVPYYSAGFIAGFSKWDGANWIFDNSTYLTTSAAALTYQPLLGYTPVNKAGDTMTGFLILNADPTNALGAVTKQYVDNISGNVNFHSPTYAASTTNLVATYLNGTAGVGATLTATSNGALNLDGVDFSLLPVLPQPYRVLIWQQTNQIENGIYVVSQVGDAGNPFILTRAADADNSPTGELAYGDFSLNQNGTLYGGYGFIMNATGTIIIGTSNVTYVQYNVAQAITAGFGLTELPANTLNVDTNVIVPYTGATTNLNLGANYLVSPIIHGSTIPSGTLTLSSTTNVTKGNILFGTSAYDEVNNRLGIGTTTPTSELDVVGATKITGLTNIGNQPFGSQLQLRVGQSTQFIDIGSVATSALISMNQNATPGLANYTILGTTTITRFNSPIFTSLQVGGIDRFTIRGVVTSGANPNFNFINPSVTGQTASTNVPNFRVDGATKQWATGNITNQYWNYFSANTADFVSASTITNSYGLFVESANVSATATITNNIGIGTNGSLLGEGQYLWLGTSTPTNSNFAVRVDGSNNTYIGSPGGVVYLGPGGAQRVTISSFRILTSLGGGTGGSITGYDFSGATYTNQVAGVESNFIKWKAPSIQFANGNIVTQRNFLIESPVYSFVSAPSTITNAYNLYVESPTAGTNATITNNYALGLKGQFFADLDGTGKTLTFKESSLYTSYGWQIATSNSKLTIPQQIWIGDSSALINRFIAGGGNYGLLIESFKDIRLSSMSPVNTFLYCVGNTGHIGIGTTTPSERLTISGGNILLEDAGNFIVGTSIGTKIGTSTSQKLGFYGVTPTTQPLAVTTPQGIADALTSLGLLATSTIEPYIPQPTELEVFRGRTFRYNSTTADTYGGIDTLNNASASAQVTSTTNFYNRFVRLRYFASIVQTGRVTSIRGVDLQWYLSGGFRFVTTFRVADTTFSSNCQQFYGMVGTISELAYGGVSLVQLETLTNLIGVGSNATDTNLNIYHNDSSGTCTKVDLGASFPANRTAGSEMTTMYSIVLYNEVNTLTVKYEVINLETGATARGILSTNLPAITQGLTIQASRAMGTPTTNTGQFEVHKWGCSDIII